MKKWKAPKHGEKSEYIHVRLRPPSRFSRMRTIKLGADLKQVYGKVKGKNQWLPQNIMIPKSKVEQKGNGIIIKTKKLKTELKSHGITSSNIKRMVSGGSSDYKHPIPKMLIKSKKTSKFLAIVVVLLFVLNTVQTASAEDDYSVDIVDEVDLNVNENGTIGVDTFKNETVDDRPIKINDDGATVVDLEELTVGPSSFITGPLQWLIDLFGGGKKKTSTTEVDPNYNTEPGEEKYSELTWTIIDFSCYPPDIKWNEETTITFTVYLSGGKSGETHVLYWGVQDLEQNEKERLGKSGSLAFTTSSDAGRTKTHSFTWTPTYYGKEVTLLCHVRNSKDIISATRHTKDYTKLIIGGKANESPNTPSRPVGPTSVEAGSSHTYYAIATDPERGKLSYQSNSNNYLSSWSSYQSSGQMAKFNIKFEYAGTYVIQVRSKDEAGEKSEWSSGLTVKAGLTYSEADAPTVSIKVTPGMIVAGDYASLSWSSTNANTVKINDNLNPTNAKAGSILISPTGSTTYTATAIGDGGTVSSYCTLEVREGEPTVSIKADKTSIVSGDGVTLTWSSERALYVEISNGVVTNRLTTGSATVYPQHTTTYTATAPGNAGIASSSITIYVTNDEGKLITGEEGGEGPWIYIFLGLLLAFVSYNLIYFQKKKKWPAYKTFFGKTWAWIRNKEYEEKVSPKKQSEKDKSYYDYIIEYGEPEFDEAAYSYRRKKKEKRKKKKEVKNE